MKMKLLLFLGAVVALSLHYPARAATATYQEGAATPILGGTYTGTEDTTLLTNGGGFFNSAPENFGKATGLATGNSGGISGFDNDWVRRGLIRFDVSSLAGQYASIDSVTLRLTVTSVDPDGDGLTATSGTLRLFSLTSANANWVEGIGTSATGFNAPPDDPNKDTGGSTWAYKVQGATTTSGTTWAGTPSGFTAGAGGSQTTNGGAGVAGVDYLVTPVASFSYISTTTGAIDFVFTDPTLIHTWITGVNSGLLIRQDTETHSARINFHSSESATASARPQLLVDYTVPEPGCISLGMFGLAAIGFRRLRAR